MSTRLEPGERVRWKHDGGWKVGRVLLGFLAVGKLDCLVVQCPEGTYAVYDDEVEPQPMRAEWEGKGMSDEKKPPTGSAEALIYCIEQAANSRTQPIELASQFEYIKSQVAQHRVQDVSKLTDYNEAARCLGHEEADAVSDDPIEWLVKEFKAESRYDFAWIPVPNQSDNWIVEFHGRHSEWLIFDNYTTLPLTRADVARLCELFGVEVKR